MRWKWIVGAVALLVCVIIAAVFIILSRYDFNDLKPQITRVVQKATGRELTLGGDIDLKISLTPKLMVENVSFQNASWGSRPEMVKIRRVEVQVALLPLLSENIEVKHLVLVEPNILIETDPTGRTNLEFEVLQKGTAPESVKKEEKLGETGIPGLIFENLRIENGKITYKDAQKNKTFAVKIENLKAYTTGPANAIRLNLKGDFNGTPFELESTMGALAKLADPDKDWPLKLTATVFDSRITLDGTIQDLSGPRGLQLKMSLASNNLANLEQLIGMTIPFKTPFQISANLTDPAPDIYKFSDLKAIIGDSRLNGSLEANLASKVSKLSASLTSPNLDLRSFFPKKGDQREKEVDKSKPKRKKVFPSDPLPIELPRSVDAEVTWRIGHLLTPRLAVGNLQLNMNLKNGQIILKPIKALIGGGTLNGYVDFKPRHKTAAVTAKIKIDQLDVGNMLQDLGITNSLYGMMAVDVNLKGQGESIATLMAGLNGTTRIVMNNGRIKNKYIYLLSGDLASSIFRLVNPFDEKTDYTNINCFVSLFDIKEGLADSTALVLSTDDNVVIGDGEINLHTEKLDFSLKSVPKGGIPGVSFSLSELTKPFKLGGTLANPSLGIDPTQTAIGIGKIFGGFTLFGPFGIVAALVGAKSHDKNPCLTAIEEAPERAQAAQAKPSEEKERRP